MVRVVLPDFLSPVRVQACRNQSHPLKSRWTALLSFPLEILGESVSACLEERVT